MIMDENKQAILMLTTYFSPPKKGEPTSLTPLEYGRFALWLRENKYQPKDLFSQFKEIFNKWKDQENKITIERLSFLIGRGMAMGVALEKWHSAGIWIITRSDIEYPQTLKKHLGNSAPAILFGVGNKKLLNAGGLSIVGSRSVDASDQEFTQHIAKQASLEKLNVVSGGAKGIDEIAMLASLEVDGTATGVLASDLFKAALSSKWRKHLQQNQLVLVSTYYPEASFNVGNAMGRNKYIYCLSDYALVIRSDKDKGGTWAGAKENLKKKWVPLFIKEPSNVAGNIALKKMGVPSLHKIDTRECENKEWLLDQLTTCNQYSGGEILQKIQTNDNINNKKQSNHSLISNGKAQDNVGKSNGEKASKINSNTVYQETDYDQTDLFYQYFIRYIEYLLEKQNPITLSKLKELRKDLDQKQIINWLDQATEEEVIIRQGKKRTYSKKEATLFCR
jgi:predicted Rossmann fold nucleotide-binding protein DprA/Smf involved in DNA uptake